MKNVLYGTALMLAGLTLPSLAAADWIAMAGNANGQLSFRSGPTEDIARDRAVTGCENHFGSTCKASISVPEFWYISAVHCSDGNKQGIYLAASKHDWDTSDSNAYAKATAPDTPFLKYECEVAWQK